MVCPREVIVVHIKCTINHVQIQIGQKLEEYKLLVCPREVIVVHIKCTINHVQIQIGQKLEEYKLLACPREVREQLFFYFLREQLSIEH